MIAPQPFKLKCLKCGLTKIIQPKSDVLNINDINTQCTKCNIKMENISLNVIEKIFHKYYGK